MDKTGGYIQFSPLKDALFTINHGLRPKFEYEHPDILSKTKSYIHSLLRFLIEALQFAPLMTYSANFLYCGNSGSCFPYYISMPLNALADINHATHMSLLIVICAVLSALFLFFFVSTNRVRSQEINVFRFRLISRIHVIVALFFFTDILMLSFRSFSCNMFKYHYYEDAKDSCHDSFFYVTIVFAVLVSCGLIIQFFCMSIMSPKLDFRRLSGHIASIRVDFFAGIVKAIVVSMAVVILSAEHHTVDGLETDSSENPDYGKKLGLRVAFSAVNLVLMILLAFYQLMQLPHNRNFDNHLRAASYTALVGISFISLMDNATRLTSNSGLTYLSFSYAITSCILGFFGAGCATWRKRRLARLLQHDINKMLISFCPSYSLFILKLLLEDRGEDLDAINILAANKTSSASTPPAIATIAEDYTRKNQNAPSLNTSPHISPLQSPNRNSTFLNNSNVQMMSNVTTIQNQNAINSVSNVRFSHGSNALAPIVPVHSASYNSAASSVNLNKPRVQLNNLKNIQSNLNNQLNNSSNMVNSNSSVSKENLDASTIQRNLVRSELMAMFSAQLSMQPNRPTTSTADPLTVKSIDPTSDEAHSHRLKAYAESEHFKKIRSVLNFNSDIEIMLRTICGEWAALSDAQKLSARCAILQLYAALYMSSAGSQDGSMPGNFSLWFAATAILLWKDVTFAAHCIRVAADTNMMVDNQYFCYIMQKACEDLRTSNGSHKRTSGVSDLASFRRWTAAARNLHVKALASLKRFFRSGISGGTTRISAIERQSDKKRISSTDKKSIEDATNLLTNALDSLSKADATFNHLIGRYPNVPDVQLMTLAFKRQFFREDTLTLPNANGNNAGISGNSANRITLNQNGDVSSNLINSGSVNVKGDIIMNSSMASTSRFNIFASKEKNQLDSNLSTANSTHEDGAKQALRQSSLSGSHETEDNDSSVSSYSSTASRALNTSHVKDVIVRTFSLATILSVASLVTVLGVTTVFTMITASEFMKVTDWMDTFSVTAGVFDLFPYSCLTVGRSASALGPVTNAFVIPATDDLEGVYATLETRGATSSGKDITLDGSLCESLLTSTTSGAYECIVAYKDGTSVRKYKDTITGLIGDSTSTIGAFTTDSQPSSVWWDDVVSAVDDLTTSATDRTIVSNIATDDSTGAINRLWVAMPLFFSNYSVYGALVSVAPFQGVIVLTANTDHNIDLINYYLNLMPSIIDQLRDRSNEFMRTSMQMNIEGLTNVFSEEIFSFKFFSQVDHTSYTSRDTALAETLSILSVQIASIYAVTRDNWNFILINDLPDFQSFVEFCSSSNVRDNDVMLSLFLEHVLNVVSNSLTVITGCAIAAIASTMIGAVVSVALIRSRLHEFDRSDGIIPSLAIIATLPRVELRRLSKNVQSLKIDRGVLDPDDDRAPYLDLKLSRRQQRYREAVERLRKSHNSDFGILDDNLDDKPVSNIDNNIKHSLYSDQQNDSNRKTNASVQSSLEIVSVNQPSAVVYGVGDQIDRDNKSHPVTSFSFTDNTSYSHPISFSGGEDYDTDENHNVKSKDVEQEKLTLTNDVPLASQWSFEGDDDSPPDNEDDINIMQSLKNLPVAQNDNSLIIKSQNPTLPFLPHRSEKSKKYMDIAGNNNTPSLLQRAIIENKDISFQNVKKEDKKNLQHKSENSKMMKSKSTVISDTISKDVSQGVSAASMGNNFPISSTFNQQQSYNLPDTSIQDKFREFKKRIIEEDNNKNYQDRIIFDENLYITEADDNNSSKNAPLKQEAEDDSFDIEDDAEAAAVIAFEEEEKMLEAAANASAISPDSPDGHHSVVFSTGGGTTGAIRSKPSGGSVHNDNESIALSTASVKSRAKFYFFKVITLNGLLLRPISRSLIILWSLVMIFVIITFVMALSAASKYKQDYDNVGNLFTTSFNCSMTALTAFFFYFGYSPDFWYKLSSVDTLADRMSNAIQLASNAFYEVANEQQGSAVPLSRRSEILTNIYYSPGCYSELSADIGCTDRGLLDYTDESLMQQGLTRAFVTWSQRAQAFYIKYNADRTERLLTADNDEVWFIHESHFLDIRGTLTAVFQTLVEETAENVNTDKTMMYIFFAACFVLVIFLCIFLEFSRRSYISSFSSTLYLLKLLPPRLIEDYRVLERVLRIDLEDLNEADVTTIEENKFVSQLRDAIATTDNNNTGENTE